MKKLDDIPKKNIFDVPEGYFEKLPTVIQARIADGSKEAEWTWSWGLSLRIALPVVVIALAGIFWFRSGERPVVDVQAELASIAPEQLELYLRQNDALYDTDVTTEELLEDSEWTNSDVEQLEKSVYGNFDASSPEFEQALDELDNEL